MNAGIVSYFKSRKTDVAWRYAIAVVLVVCCIGLAYVEIVVAPWSINEVVSMFPETTLLKEPSMFWEWAILLVVQATLLCTAAKLVVPGASVGSSSWTAGYDSYRRAYRRVFGNHYR